jgi:hypothetical protein
MSDIVERLRHCSKNCGDEYLHELTGKAADTIAHLTAEVESLRMLLCRVHRHPLEPECQLADDGKCPGPCVCGYFEWFEKDHALTNEIRAALSGDKQ